jgi:hypothetical protein
MAHTRPKMNYSYGSKTKSPENYHCCSSRTLLSSLERKSMPFLEKGLVVIYKFISQLEKKRVITARGWASSQ